MIFITVKHAKKCYVCGRWMFRGSRAILVVVPYFARKEGVSSRTKLKHEACGGTHPFLAPATAAPRRTV